MDSTKAQIERAAAALRTAADIFDTADFGHDVRFETREVADALTALAAQGEAAQPAAEGLAEHTAALSSFLDALDEWGCEDNGERAKAIIQFINDGCDLSEYEDRPASPNAASQDGGRE